MQKRSIYILVPLSLNVGSLNRGCLRYHRERNHRSYLVRLVLGTSRVHVYCRGAQGTLMGDVNNVRSIAAVYTNQEYSSVLGARGT